MADKFVRITFSEDDQRRKLMFRQRDLRDVVNATSKPIGDLMMDSFGGWPYLLQYGLRAYDPSITLDRASELMDIWVQEPDPATNLERTTEELGKKLIEALNASKFIRIDLARKDAEPVEAPEGNARPEAVTRIE